MLCWEMGKPARGPHGGRGGDGEAPESAEWLAWQRRLWRELTVGAIPYGIAHVLFALHGRVGTVLGNSPDLQIAQLLFLLGTLLLYRVIRTLERPPASGQPASLQQGGACLALSMALSLSPVVWWLLNQG
jgi:hypothetical protein